MDSVVIACASSMLVVMAVVGHDIARYHNSVKKGPQCARCSLYQTTCQISLNGKDDSETPDTLILTSEMVIK